MATIRLQRLVARVLFSAGLVFGLSACCSAPEPTRLFDPHLDPVEAMRQFRFSVATGQDEVAFKTLTERSREEISLFGLWYFLRNGELPGFEDVEPRAFVLNSTFDPRTVEYNPARDRARIRLEFEDESMQLSAEQWFYFRRGPDGWAIDLLDIVDSLAIPQA